MILITEEIQKQFFDEFETPPHIQRHCNEVARVAGILGKVLNDNGYDIDVDTMVGAARVHDMVRLWPEHDNAAADILIERGYPKEAELVRLHMKYYPYSPVDELGEQDVLCLSDRVVREDEYVGIDRRFQYLIDKPGTTPELAKLIRESGEFTKGFIKEIEAVIGAGFDELLKKPEE
jgi:uncharacterized protein